MTRKETFDHKGLLLAIEEVEKGYTLPLPDKIKVFGFCLVCLGSNVPGEKSPHSKNGFCCGSWCDGLLPAWGICERFQLDQIKLQEITKIIRPNKGEVH